MSGLENVPASVLERLRCPVCGAPLHAELEIEALACASGHLHRLEAGYLDATGDGSADSSTARTFESFGYEWNAFDEVRPEDEDFARIYFRDLDLSRLKGQVGLDAGCGKGRFTRVLACHLASVVALDGSDAVEAATRNLKDVGNVFVVKADLRSAPLAPESFDFIVCLGVLHHLEDPHEGFRRLVSYLGPEGRLVVYLYSAASGLGVRAGALAAARIMRRITVWMPRRMLELLCVPIASVLYWSMVVPGRFGKAHSMEPLARLPMATYRDKPFRSLVLDTFDRLSAPIEHRFHWRDIDWWFEEAGLVVESARDEAGWFVVARRA